MKKTLSILLAAFMLLGAVSITFYSYYNVDMTGKPYEEIEAFRANYPNRTVTYTVSIEGDTPVQLTNSTTEAQLSLSHADSLLAQCAYLQDLTSIDFPGETLTAKQMNDITRAFPGAAVTCSKISFLGKEYGYATTHVDLSDLTPEQVSEAGAGLQALPRLETVELCKGDALSTLPLEAASALHALCPEAAYHYRVKLFGQELTTDMEQVEYFQKKIYDEGLEQFRLLLPMMHKLTYFKLDWCKTSDEAMAQLRDDFAPQGIKVVWRIFFGEKYNALTDTYKIWANWTVNDTNNSSLQYCTEAKYVDLGHTMITHCEWVRNMPDLEVIIMGDTNLKSLEPLTACKKLTFLELFHTLVTDLSPLAEMENLQYLNISNLKIKDISPIYHLDNMIHVNAVLNTTIPEDQIAEYKRLQPQCESYFLSYGNATRHNWRYDINGRILPRYALLRQQIGYDYDDLSCYPTGYLREEVTYESTGITPPEAYNGKK